MSADKISEAAKQHVAAQLRRNVDLGVLSAMTSNVETEPAEPLTVEKVMKAIEDLGPTPPDPFNDAQRLQLAADVADLIVPRLPSRFKVYGCEVEVNPHLPDGYGLGWRRAKEGDDPKWIDFNGNVICWVLTPGKDGKLK